MIEQYIDHTVLAPTTTNAQIEKLCTEAIENNFIAVCVPQHYVKMATNLTKDSAVMVATVIGFPFGYNTTASKVEEALDALADGADEIDMVHNIAAVKNADWDYVDQEVAAIYAPIKAAGKALKVIIESGILTDEEIIKSCEIYTKHNVDFVKTSTGYAATGATLHAVQLMKANIPATMGLKASGGIRTYAFAKELIDAGATRIGASAGIAIKAEENQLS